jgi:transcriptional regulator with XRE-family HTH domain
MPPKLLRIYRQAMDCTKTQIADALGFYPQDWHRWETGIRKPGAGRLYELSKILGVSMEDLYEDYNKT